MLLLFLGGKAEALRYRGWEGLTLCSSKLKPQACGCAPRLGTRPLPSPCRVKVSRKVAPEWPPGTGFSCSASKPEAATGPSLDAEDLETAVSEASSSSVFFCLQGTGQGRREATQQLAPAVWDRSRERVWTGGREQRARESASENWTGCWAPW